MFTLEETCAHINSFVISLIDLDGIFSENFNRPVLKIKNERTSIMLNDPFTSTPSFVLRKLFVSIVSESLFKLEILLEAMYLQLLTSIIHVHKYIVNVIHNSLIFLGYKIPRFEV